MNEQPSVRLPVGVTERKVYRIVCCLVSCDAESTTDTPFALPRGWVRIVAWGYVLLPERTYCSLGHAEEDVLSNVQVLLHDRSQYALLGETKQIVRDYRLHWQQRHALEVEQTRRSAQLQEQESHTKVMGLFDLGKEEDDEHADSGMAF